MVPKKIRDTAAAVLHNCILDRGLGGYATYGIRDLVDQVFPIAQVRAGALSSLSIHTTFITVTISAKGRRSTAPGNFDPGVPESIAQKFTTKYTQAQLNSGAELLYATSAKTWNMKTEGMRRGGTTPWWRPADASDEMAYECDAGLGSPPSVDCNKIEWSQLGPGSDTVSVGPGQVTFLHSNTCYLAISASVALLITWEQIRAAVSALMNVCVQHPFGPPQGGRAFYGHQPPPQAVSGRKVKREHTGLNALPPHANITVFQQNEAWTNPEAELNTCTWKAVAKGLPVTTCKNL